MPRARSAHHLLQDDPLRNVMISKGIKVKNMKNFSVKIAYKNRDLEQVSEWVYDFEQYADMMKRELTRIIMDVEDVIYHLDGRSKDEWDAETTERFQRIRHKLLDQANAIERLPQNLYYKGVNCMSINASEMLAEMIDKIAEK